MGAMTPEALEALRLQLVQRLPPRVRWTLDGTPWAWDFSRAREPLRPLSAEESEDWLDVLPRHWSELFVFGEYDFAAGGGASPFITVHSQKGEVHGLDIEREGDVTFLLNSSVSRFIDTILVFDEVLGTRGAPATGLLERVRAADPVVFVRSEWRDAAEHVVETLSARD